METKLKVGDVILVHGWVMLRKLEDGVRYRLLSITDYHGSPTYTFKKASQHRRIRLIRHYVSSVDTWIRPMGHPDLNRIEIIGEDTENASRDAS